MRTKVGSNPATLYYLFSDHLGSTSLTVNSAGDVIAELRYDAFGNTRYRQGDTPTDYQYTGQRFESGIGLYYYNARWYDPALGRFAQADTIIPPGVQGLDRYAYVNNNPLVYTDPSGHYSDCSQVPGAARAECERSNYNEKLWNDPELFDQEFGITFTGEWREDHKEAVRRAVWAVGHAFAGHVGASAAGAFQTVYGGVTFQWGNCAECNGGGAFTAGPHRIKFASMAADWHPDRELRWRNLVVHELGHAFNQGIGYFAADALSWTQTYHLDPDKATWFVQGFPDRPDYPANHAPGWTGPNSGFASPQNVLVWQMAVNQAGSTSEEFADMFLGWTFNMWEDSDAGRMRARWMGNHMPDFLDRLP